MGRGQSPPFTGHPVEEQHSHDAQFTRSSPAFTIVELLVVIGIPGLSDIDKALDAIQHDAVSVKITGFLDDPQTTPILFGDITRNMKYLLFGDAQTSKE